MKTRRPSSLGGIDMRDAVRQAAAVVALVSPTAMLVLWTISLGFLAATSDGIERVWMKKSAVRKAPNEVKSAARRRG